MTDNRISSHDLNEQLYKRDLEIILEVNKKAIEIETCVADQNEEELSLLHSTKEGIKEIKDKLDIIKKQNDDALKELFTIKVLFVTGLLSLVVQIIQIFKNLK